MVQPLYWNGWSSINRLSPMCRYGINLMARRVCSVVRILPGMKPRIATIVPLGKTLLSRRRHFKNERTHITKANTIIYRCSQPDCKTCPLKLQCCPNTTFRKIARSIYEGSRDVARDIAKTPQYQQSRKDRKKVEMLFAHLKRILKLDRLRLRGLSGARDEFLMAATVQNLRRLAKLKYKPPDQWIAAPA